ncbi:hypothetical protein TgHK011_000561 [Trichoderma gracile]|nr:hypothetical protein TgHK011_000561 [Trichoderma gracile]
MAYPPVQATAPLFPVLPLDTAFLPTGGVGRGMTAYMNTGNAASAESPSNATVRTHTPPALSRLGVPESRLPFKDLRKVAGLCSLGAIESRSRHCSYPPSSSHCLSIRILALRHQFFVLNPGFGSAVGAWLFVARSWTWAIHVARGTNAIQLEPRLMRGGEITLMVSSLACGQAHDGHAWRLTAYSTIRLLRLLVPRERSSAETFSAALSAVNGLMAGQCCRPLVHMADAHAGRGGGKDSHTTHDFSFWRRSSCQIPAKPACRQTSPADLATDRCTLDIRCSQDVARCMNSRQQQQAPLLDKHKRACHWRIVIEKSHGWHLHRLMIDTKPQTIDTIGRCTVSTGQDWQTQTDAFGHSEAARALVPARFITASPTLHRFPAPVSSPALPLYVFWRTTPESAHFWNATKGSVMGSLPLVGTIQPLAGSWGD